MPYAIRKVNKQKCYRVTSKNKSKTKTKRRVFSKCTTKSNAEKQLRLLNAIHYNKSFVPNGRTRKNRK
jgi:hypothetical protein